MSKTSSSSSPLGSPSAKKRSQTQELRIPDGLKARCMRLHGWDDDLVDRAIAGYRQFMTLKSRLGDWQATALSPPTIVEQVWQQHILDVDHYVFACDEFCGRRIGHDPDDDPEKRAERIKATQIACKTLNGRDIDEEIWSFEPATSAEAAAEAAAAASSSSSSSDQEEEEEEDSCAAVRSKKIKNNHNNPQRSSSSSKKRTRSPSDKSATTPKKSHKRSTSALEALTIRVGNYCPAGNYVDTYFKIRPDTKMQKVFDRFALHWGTSVHDFSFLYANRNVSPHDDALKLGMQDGDVIYATTSSAVLEE